MCIKYINNTVYGRERNIAYGRKEKKPECPIMYDVIGQYTMEKTDHLHWASGA